MSSTDALGDVGRIVAAGGDADDVLRAVVAALAKRYAWAGIFFVEGDELVLGPEAGQPQADRRTQLPVTWNARSVATLAVDGAADRERESLERVAALIADHCLVGWDTGGEKWSP